MATRRTSDSTRTPKSAAPSAPKSTKAPSTQPTDAKASTAKPAVIKPAAPKATDPKATDPKVTGSAKRVAKPKAPQPAAATRVSEDTRRAMIAESAYLRAERRGFTNGNETDDWTAAEKEVDALLSANTGTGTQ